MPRYTNNASVQVGGDAADWDHADPAKVQAFKDVAGPQFLGTADGGTVAVVLNEEGHDMRVYTGWWALREDGGDLCTFAAPGNFGRPGSLLALVSAG